MIQNLLIYICSWIAQFVLSLKYLRLPHKIWIFTTYFSVLCLQYVICTDAKPLWDLFVREAMELDSNDEMEVQLQLENVGWLWKCSWIVKKDFIKPVSGYEGHCKVIWKVMEKTGIPEGP